MLDLRSLALGIVVLVITVSIGTAITATVRDTFTADTAEYNNTDAGVDALGEFSDWYSIIIITGVGAFILGMLVWFGRSNNNGEAGL